MKENQIEKSIEIADSNIKILKEKLNKFENESFLKIMKKKKKT